MHPMVVEGDIVFLVDFVTRVSQTLSEVAVVSQKEESFGLGVESTNIEKARELWGQKIEDGVAHVGVGSSGNKAGRFVEDQVNVALSLNQF